ARSARGRRAVRAVRGRGRAMGCGAVIGRSAYAPTRDAEFVCASTASLPASIAPRAPEPAGLARPCGWVAFERTARCRAETWTLKQVQGDDRGIAACATRSEGRWWNPVPSPLRGRVGWGCSAFAGSTRAGGALPLP